MKLPSPMGKAWLAVVIVIGLTACTTTDPTRNVFNGEPVIADEVWLRSNAITDDPKSAKFIPEICVDVRYLPLPPASAPPPNVNDCIEAMRNLIDTRFNHWADSLNGSVSTTNFFFDVTAAGLGAAGSLAGGPTSQVINAVTGALAGTRTAIDTDFLYNATVKIIIQQMEADRRCWSTIIEKRLDDKTYQSLDQGFNDLIAYSRAGSFTQALVTIQSEAGSKNNANKVGLQKAKIDNGKPSTGKTTKATRKPAATMADNGTAAKTAASGDGEDTGTDPTVVKTCGAYGAEVPDMTGKGANKQDTASNEKETNGTPADTADTSPSDDTVAESTPVTIKTPSGQSVTLPFASSFDPVDMLRNASADVAKKSTALANSVKDLVGRIDKLKEPDKAAGYAITDGDIVLKNTSDSAPAKECTAQHVKHTDAAYTIESARIEFECFTEDHILIEEAVLLSERYKTAENAIKTASKKISQKDLDALALALTNAQVESAVKSYVIQQHEAEFDKAVEAVPVVARKATQYLSAVK